MLRGKIYVGVRHVYPTNQREVFRAEHSPTVETHGKDYVYVIGPFRTMAGARFMAEFGSNNPHCQHVDDAERLSREVTHA